MMTVGNITQLTTDKGPLPERIAALPPVRVEADVRCLIADMAVVLSDFEESAWDGDPLRRREDALCIKARKLIDQANAVVEANIQSVKASNP